MQVVEPGWHWHSHFVSFAILAFAWRCGLPGVSAWVIALATIAFGFAHEAIEIVGHAHDYEWADAVVDGIGAIVGVLFAYLPVRFLCPEAAIRPPL